MQLTKKHKTHTHINTNEPTQSEMGPVRQNPIQRTVRIAHLRVLIKLSEVQMAEMVLYLVTMVFRKKIAFSL